jgi:putative resolvase
MNETRPTARRLLADPAMATVVVKDRDRPGQVNTGQAEAAPAELAAGKVAGGLVRDRTGVLSSGCARRHGRGPARNRAQNAQRSAARHISPSHPGATA